MSLPSGTKLGPYEITGTLGTGGMGEVYRAHDSKLNREVAIKVVPETLAADPAALSRFQREAQAVASLSHPNILAIFDFGIEGKTPYAVMELLEGRSLRGALAEGALPVRKAIDYALQIAAGLSAAHARGITHRDLKPENAFVTKDGRVKILDFGLAKVHDPEMAGAGQSFAPTKSVTAPGAVLGTVGYMAPEQVRGQTVDARADIFALGAILYELLSGQRAFSGPSAVETLNAILKEDPPELMRANASLPPALDRIVRRCLEKSPDERFQSVRDLAFALEAISGGGGEPMAPIAGPVKVPRKSRNLVLAAIGALVFLSAGIGIGWFMIPRSAPLSSPRLTRLTFDRGTVRNARFTPDGKTVIYGASWNGLPYRVFQTRLGDPQSNDLPLPNADVLAISANGQMAISLDRRNVAWMFEGTLAYAPIVGGSTRPILEHVRSADWFPDGSGPAIVRRVDGRDQLEFPIGTVLKETVTTGYISHARVSPAGDVVAYLDHPVLGDNRGFVAIVTIDGRKQRLTAEWAAEEGLAWSPDGKEIWFTASTGGRNELMGVTRERILRQIWSVPADLSILDTFPDGRVLITATTNRVDVYLLGPGESGQRNISWLSNAGLQDVSADGKTVLFTRYDEGSGRNYEVGVRHIDDPTCVSLGQGAGVQLSPDTKWALSIVKSEPTQLILLPTGVGEARNLTSAGFRYLTGGWFPDNKKLLLVAEEGGQAPACYVQDVAGGAPRRIKAPVPSFIAEFGLRVSPDQKRFTAVQAEGLPNLTPLEDGAPASLQNLGETDWPICWSSDGRALFVVRDSSDRKGALILRYDLATGVMTTIKQIEPPDAAGMWFRPICVMTPDGKAVVYSVGRYLTDLYLVEGLK
jgi:serine/threonine protein kinase/Tol biopolymer transport system component